MIIHMRHALWTGISETNVNVITSATRNMHLIIIIEDHLYYVIYINIYVDVVTRFSISASNRKYPVRQFDQKTTVASLCECKNGNSKRFNW